MREGVLMSNGHAEAPPPVENESPSTKFDGAPPQVDAAPMTASATSATIPVHDAVSFSSDLLWGIEYVCLILTLVGLAMVTFARGPHRMEAVRALSAKENA